MYASHFGLKQPPFSIAPDPRYLFMSDRHREALAHLLYGLDAGGGFVLLTGEIGAGKTTVCRCFLEQIPRRCNVAYIFNPKLTVIELLQSVCEEFRIPHSDAAGTIKDYIDPLNEYLLRTHAVGQNNVLIIDEAQNLSAEVLEQLRLLTNLETQERKLLQIILIGQPELRTMLARPELEQLAQRVIARYHLDALSEPESAQYIQHRLTIAGLKHGQPFGPTALHRVHQLTRGVPRRINLLCDRALLGAYSLGRAQVDVAVIDRAATEVFGAAAKISPPIGAAKAPSQPAWGAVQRWPVRQLAAVATSVALLAVGAWAWTQVKTAPSAKASTNGTVDTALAASPAPASAASAASPATRVNSTALTLDATAVDGLPLTPAWRKEESALKALAELWQLPAAEGKVCASAPAQNVQCFKAIVGFETLRQLDRPGVLTLLDAKGARHYAVLTQLTTQIASLRLGANTVHLPLDVLSSVWQGEFTTLWRAPSSYSGPLRQGQSGPAVQALAALLAKAVRQPSLANLKTLDEGLQTPLANFQGSQGLKPDGVGGPTTFMLLNRLNGLDEPRVVAAER